MKNLKLFAAILALLLLAASCSQNHYAKAKRKMTDVRGQTPMAWNSGEH